MIHTPARHAKGVTLAEDRETGLILTGNYAGARKAHLAPETPAPAPAPAPVGEFIYGGAPFGTLGIPL